MRRTRIAAFAAIAGVIALSAFTSARQQSADEQDIRRVVTDYYFNHAGDSTLLRQGFNLSAAHMLFVAGDTLVNVPILDYIHRVAPGGPRPAGSPAPASNVVKRVLMVDVSGKAAVAKLELSSPQGITIDYMSLLKIGGRWQVVNKIFDRLPPR
jgi:hypothetical protein